MNSVDFKKINFTKAQAYNAKKTAPLDWPKNTASKDFVIVTAQFQNWSGLEVDGFFGPTTQAKVSELLSQARPSNYVIVGGKRHEVPFQVVTWEQDAFWKTERHFKYRMSPVELMIWHWDVVPTARQTHTGLMREGRNASVHFYQDDNGIFYQSCDLLYTRTWHAGSAGDVNERSVGCESNNVCYPNLDRRVKPRPLIKEKPTQGNPVWEHLDFFDVQKQTMLQMSVSICDIFGLPKRLPTRPEFESRWKGDDADADGSVVRGLLDKKGLYEFTGVAGHFHYDEDKIDPGVGLFEYFQQHGPF